MDSLLDELRGQGRPDSAGRFRVDWAGASAVLGRFLLAEPLDVLLKLVQAAVAGGASYLHVSGAPEGGLAFEFDRPELTRLDLETLTGALLDKAPTARRELALSLNSALRTNYLRATLRTPEGCLVATQESWEVFDRPCGSPRLVLVGIPPQLTELASRCPHPPLELRLPVAQWAYAYPVAELRHEGARQHVWMPATPARLCIRLEPEDDYPEMSVGLNPSESWTARVWLSIRGVCQIVEVPWGTRGALALVSADGLPTDLSGLKVVDGPEYQELLEDLGRETVRLRKEVDRKLSWLPPDQRLGSL